MTTAALTNLPLAAGSALLGATGRAALWGLAHYAKAPLSNTAILALACFSLMAGSNALYFQDHRHPAPLFGGTTQVASTPKPVPVVPAVRKGKPVVPNVEQQTMTGSVPAKPAAVAAPAAEPIGNAEVFEIQRKLAAIGYFEGIIDGYYGPKTARAIKRFEEVHGLKVRGMLTREIIAAINAAPITAEAPKPAPFVASEPVPEPTPIVAIEPVAPAPSLATETIAVTPPAEAQLIVEPMAIIKPLPTPAPLQPAITEASVQREMPATPQDAMNIAVDVANQAVDAAVDVIQGKVQLGPTAQPLPPKPQPVVQAIAEEAPPVADPVADIVTAAATTVPQVSSTDPRLVSKVQQGLANLGFLHGAIDGVAGEATAKAIRNFEVYFNFNVTGRVSPELVDMLTDAGAYI